MRWLGGSLREDRRQPLPSTAGQRVRVSAAQATASARGRLMPAQMSVAQATRTQPVILWPKHIHRAPSLPPFLPPQRYPNSKSLLLRLEVRFRILMISCIPQPFIWGETALNDPFFLV